MFKLVIQDDEGKTTVVPLIRDEITIGRKEGNTIRLTERNVSRRHARILRNNGEVQIEDLGSYNGIRVNNARIAERVSLRISDQVQIGDYKLYLKAEGVEQVDDARTMPIERIENQPAPTEQMAAVAPTAPIQATPAPAPRAMGVADTDPAGRPVATAAQVAALTAPAGYGKLVVVSSNFAGKEFELTRPQMIVGRTDENDMVVNHRSISRNHAKITRDPETQRYTISDLQSSNGVRVNGQDYGKVELRRGDVVDLGHVRLRFVEPGEDFVFARDAVINDVPESGGKKGLMIAVILAIVVLGAIGAFFFFKSGEKPTDHGGMVDGSNGSAGSALAVQTGSGSDHNPAITGSGGSAVAIIDIDAGPGSAATTNPDTTGDAKRITSECLALVAEEKWPDLTMCADKLAALDPKQASAFKAKAGAETRADIEKGKMESELSNSSLPKARKHLDAIPDESAYKKPAQTEYDAAEQKVIEDFKGRAIKLKRANKCPDIDTLVSQANAQGARVAAEVRALKCETVVPPPVDCSTALKEPGDKKCLKQFCSGAGHDDSRCPQATVVAPPPQSCDQEALLKIAEGSVALGNHGQALKQYEDALHCKSDSHTLQLTFMEACNANNASKAKVYWKKLSTELQNRALQICVRNKITRDQLDSP